MNRSDVLEAYRLAVAAVDPEAGTRTALTGMPLETPVNIAAVGKAAPAMVRGATQALASQVRSVLAVSDHTEPMPAGARLLVGSHPMPDAASRHAGRALLEFVAALPADELLLVLVSGGGSALAEVPAGDLTVDQVAGLTRRLMDTATPIDQLNLVRRHLSTIKNGGLLRAASSRRVLTLLVSDVIDGDPSVIASGPTIADGSTVEQARSVLAQRLGIEVPLPPDPPPDDRHDHQILVVADCSNAARAAADALDADIWTVALRGEASEMARAMLDACEDRPLVAAGETTVTVRGTGRGGRNQEAALAAAIALDDRPGMFAALGTDGIDGPTEAAGAIVDGGSAGRMRAAGIDPAMRLANNDANAALRASEDLVVTGPSGTNVGDLWIALP